MEKLKSLNVYYEVTSIARSIIVGTSVFIAVEFIIIITFFLLRVSPFKIINTNMATENDF